MAKIDLDPAALDKAAKLIREADALLVCTGAGMGVDSGLPDFRANDGFWQAYPAYARLGLSFTGVATPQSFKSDPETAWGLHAHRLGLSRSTTPHAGFGFLRGWGGRLRHGLRVYTSSVDGHFQRAGFTGVVDIHGSIHHLQCLSPCCGDVWSAEHLRLELDESTLRATASSLPRCPRCGGVARPNVILFDDWDWVGSRTREQERGQSAWLQQLAIARARLAVIEIGAGRNAPTVRFLAEYLATQEASRHPRSRSTLIRIHPTDADIPAGGGVALAGGALTALTALDERLRH